MIDFFQIICLIIIILIFITLPEILPILYGREVIIPILSQISLEGRFGILFSFSIVVFSFRQHQISKSLLRIEKERDIARQLDERTRARKKNVDDIISPLYFEMEKIIEALQLDDFTETGLLRGYDKKWRLMENTSMEIRAKNIDARIPEFYNRLKSLRLKYIDLSAHFRPEIDELFKNEVSKMKSSFHLRYETGYETEEYLSPHRYLIFGLNPIDKIFEKISNYKIKIYLSGNDMGVNYGDIKSECETFFAAVEEKIGKDPKIACARAERINLIEISTKIHNDLGKMVLA